MAGSLDKTNVCIAVTFSFVDKFTYNIKIFLSLTKQMTFCNITGGFPLK